MTATAQQINPEFMSAMQSSTPAWFAYTASNGAWMPYRHLMHLDRKLMDVATGKTKRLMVFMPPQHGKSEFVSKYFTAWYLGRFPDRRIILTGYGGEFATEWGRKSRDLLEEHGQSMFGIQIAKNSHAAHRWNIFQRRGSLHAAGAGGQIVGRPADLFIIDDPVKGAREALSKTYKKTFKDWYISTVESRLQKNAAIIIIQTRWDMDDLSGWLLSEQDGGDGMLREEYKQYEWDVVCFPALAEKDDPLGRQVGEALCPELHGEQELLYRKRYGRGGVGGGTYWWNALYQQHPIAIENALFKPEWWRFHDSKDGTGFDQMIMSWDMTFKDTTDGSYVCGQVWGRREGNKYLLDQVRGRWDFPDTIKQFLALNAKWPACQAKLVEDKANGPAVISTLRNRISGILPVSPRGSKEARAAGISPQVESGNVYLPMVQAYPWVQQFMDNHRDFPATADDDEVDCTSQALAYLPDAESVGFSSGAGSSLYGAKDSQGEYEEDDMDNSGAFMSSGGISDMWD